MTSFNKCFGFLCGFVPVMLCGCVSTPSFDESVPKSYSVKDQAVYCRLDHDAWYRVVGYNEAEVSVFDMASSFSDIWKQTDQAPEIRSNEVITKSWQALLLPLPDLGINCWGYASTYTKHRKEVELEESFRFPKTSPAQTMFASIAYRPHLDYEAEIGILLHKNDPGRFGYVMVNDLTDRGLQVRTFDKDNPAPGFSKAKSFAGALRVGPLLMIGDESIWNEIEIGLSLNREIRQQVYGRECSLTPKQFHQETFSTDTEKDWVLTATGTSAGVIFHTPNTLQKLMLLVRSVFSKSRATEKWLASLLFLRDGDKVEFRSPLLGVGKAKVVNEE